MSRLLLVRYASLPYGTIGQLFTPRGQVFATIEPPWLDNRKNLSCIPPGTYQLIEMPSPLTERITNGKHKSALFLQLVTNRSDILIHPGNFMRDTKGCILVGRRHDAINGKPGVAASQSAFADLMQEDAASPFKHVRVSWYGDPSTPPYLNQAV